MLDRLRGNRQQYVFVLAHMRSGSSLLLHLLASHAAIAGCGERNTLYRGQFDLDRLALKTRLYNRCVFRPPQYVADQINHNNLVESPDLLRNPRLKCVFLLREPAGAISSMLDVLQEHYGTQYEEAATYYRERLGTLVEYASVAGERSFVLTYGDLTGRTEETLSSLRRFLELETPLTPAYRIFDFTGKSGDPSPTIREGRIVENRRVTDHRIPAAELGELQQLFENSVRALKARCTSMDSQKNWSE